MNPTLQHIFDQLNQLKTANQQQQAQIAALLTQAKKQRYPQEWIAACVLYPDLIPFPFSVDLQATPKTNGAKFAVSVEEAIATYKADVDTPLFLIRLTASLQKVEGRDFLNIFRPLAMDRFQTLTGSEAHADFLWSAEYQSKAPFTSVWMPSTLLNGDHEQGWIFPCAYELKKGETLTLKALPLKACAEGDGYDLNFQIHLVKMIPDVSKIIRQQASGDMV